MSLTNSFAMSAVGTYDDWSVTGTKPAAVNSDDDDTSFVNVVGDGSDQVQTFTAVIPDNLEAVSTHTVHAKVRYTATTGTFIDRIVAYHSAALSYSGALGIGATYADKTATDLASATLTRSQAIAFEVGLSDGDGGGGSAAGNNWRCTYLYWTVTYSIYVGSVLDYFYGVLPLLGAAVGADSIPGLLREVRRQGGPLVTGDDVWQMWRELKAYPHPSYC